MLRLGFRHKGTVTACNASRRESESYSPSLPVPLKLMQEQDARPRFKIPSPVDPTDSDEEAPQSAQDPVVAYDVDWFFY